MARGRRRKVLIRGTVYNGSTAGIWTFDSGVTIVCRFNGFRTVKGKNRSKGPVRTVFDIVLGILLTVVKASLHALVSTAGALAFCAAVLLVGVYALQRHAAQKYSAKAAEVVSIHR